MSKLQLWTHATQVEYSNNAISVNMIDNILSTQNDSRVMLTKDKYFVIEPAHSTIKPP